ncbi:MAG: hypothetical protein A2176_11255 [Spirochaetes bacterium RBG_13_51_14]|nr:MAG: hypothetical protein A2176_11255 [Spirochaetes bacterium RBG_13_51_14]
MSRKFMISLVLCALLPAYVASQAVLEKSAPEPPDEKDFCASCHERLPDSILKKPVAEWRASVHAGGGTKCSLCHGGDPGINNKALAKSKKANYIGAPDKKVISEFCGRAGCHATALEQFKRGPHYLSVQKTTEPSCTTCHGVHGIQRSSIEVISAKSCSACHTAEYSKDLVGLIAGIDRGLSEIDTNVKYLTDRHAEVQKIQDRLNNARHLFHQFVHVFSRHEMEYTKKILEIEIENLDSETKMKVSSIRRMDLLYIAMTMFGLVIIVGISIYTLVMYSKRRK